MSRVSSASGTNKSTSSVPQYQLSALAALACTLDARRYTVSERTRRASVCIILRVANDNNNNTSATAHINSISSNSSSSSTYQSKRKYSTTEQFNDSEPPQPRSSRQLVNILTSINRLGVHSGFHELNNELQILYMLRQHNPRDRWSGQIAFPGGRKSTDKESDEQTCIRETWEEIGIDLTNKSNYIQLGRLDDYHIDPLAAQMKSLAVSVFIYLQLNNNVQMKLDTKEVRAVIWCNVSYFTQPRLPWASLKFPVTRVTDSDKQRNKTPGETHMTVDTTNNNNQLNNTNTMNNHQTNSSTTPRSSPAQYGLSSFVSQSSDNFKALLPVSLFPFSIHFPALVLPGTFHTSDGNIGHSTGNIHVIATQDAENVHITSIQSNDDNGNTNTIQLPPDDHTANEFVLWGFTLRLTAQLMLVMGSPDMQKYLDMSDRSSRILQWIVRTNDSIQSLSVWSNLGSWKRRKYINNNHGEIQNKNTQQSNKTISKL